VRRRTHAFLVPRNSPTYKVIKEWISLNMFKSYITFILIQYSCSHHPLQFKHETFIESMALGLDRNVRAGACQQTYTQRTKDNNIAVKSLTHSNAIDSSETLVIGLLITNAGVSRFIGSNSRCISYYD
jgi:hypothetical protein